MSGKLGYTIRDLVCIKIDGPYVARFLSQTPMFDWYVVIRGPKSKHHRDTCLREIELLPQILTLERTYVFN